MSFNLESYIQTYNPHKETVDFLRAKASGEVKPSNENAVKAAREASIKTSEEFGGQVDFLGTEKEICIPPSATTGYIQTYNPHKETVDFLRAKASREVKPSNEKAVKTAREASIKTSEEFGGQVDFLGTEKEICIPPSATTDTLPVTVYRPSVGEQSPVLPIVVYFHGGGNVTKSRKTNENVCRILARDTPCIVVSVEYRLAPEHKFPANNEDAKLAVEWVVSNKEVVGGSSVSKVGVAGDSAGGRLAAVVCHETYTIINFAILVYPKYDYTKTYNSTEKFGLGPLLPKKRSDWYAEQYIKEEEKSLPRASVILNKEFSYLPPTLIIVAEHDQLRDEYHEKLKTFGVDVQLELVKGVPHSFWSLPGAFKETCKIANTFITDFIRRHSNEEKCS